MDGLSLERIEGSDKRMDDDDDDDVEEEEEEEKEEDGVGNTPVGNKLVDEVELGGDGKKEGYS